MQPFIHDGLQKDDCAESIERSTRSGSVDKSSHRTSVFVEHHDLPPVWGKDSQPGYKGKRILGLLPSQFPEGPYANSGPLGAYDPKYTDPGRLHRTVYVGYEMPERYGVKETGWKEESVIPLASNNNSWVPPIVQERRVCGVARWAFWTVFACILFLIIGSVIGGVIAGVTLSKKSTTSGNSNSAVVLNATTSYSTSMSSSTSTSTLSNGDVIYFTSVYTAVQTIKPQTTSAKSQTSSTTILSTSPSSTTSSSYNATSFPTLSPSSITSTSTGASPSSTQSSSGNIYLLDCPAINGNTVSATAGTVFSSYLITCNADSTSIINTVTAKSMLECFNACAQYTNFQPITCRGATFNAKVASGNCFLRSDVSSTFSTGSDDSIAIAVLQ